MGKTQGGQQRSKSPSPQGNQFLSLENIENREVLWGGCQGFSMDGQINPGINGEPSWKVEWCTPGISTNGFFGLVNKSFPTILHGVVNPQNNRMVNGHGVQDPLSSLQSVFWHSNQVILMTGGGNLLKKLRNFTQNFHKTPFNLI